MKIDFHVHTDASFDSLIKPKDLAKKSGAGGIIPAITDHDTMAGCKKMKKIGQAFIPGCEIRTLQGDLIGLFLTEEIPKKLDFFDTVDRIRAQGGLVYLPHMHDKTRRGCGEACAPSADIIEIFNGRCFKQFNEMAEKTAKALKKPGAAGSDSHFLFEFGNAYTEVPDFDIESPAQLLKALKSRQTKLYCRASPLYVRGPTWVLSKTKKLLRGIEDRLLNK